MRFVVALTYLEAIYDMIAGWNNNLQYCDIDRETALVIGNWTEPALVIM